MTPPRMHPTTFRLVAHYLNQPSHSEPRHKCTEFYIHFLPNDSLPKKYNPNTGYGLPIIEVSRSHITTQHSRQDSSGRVISSLQRHLPDDTQHSQQTNIHDPGGIQTHNLSRQAAAHLRLRPLGHWDRLPYIT
jgi:hypothetical protein